MHGKYQRKAVRPQLRRQRRHTRPQRRKGSLYHCREQFLPHRFLPRVHERRYAQSEQQSSRRRFRAIRQLFHHRKGERAFHVSNEHRDGYHGRACGNSTRAGDSYGALQAGLAGSRPALFLQQCARALR